MPRLNSTFQGTTLVFRLNLCLPQQTKRRTGLKHSGSSAPSPLPMGWTEQEVPWATANWGSDPLLIRMLQIQGVLLVQLHGVYAKGTQTPCKSWNVHQIERFW